jgi:hypothetical protein
MTWPETDRPDVERAQVLYESTLLALDRIARAAPPPPTVKRGAPFQTKDLRAAVEVLVDYWEDVTGEPFTQNWHDGEPLTEGTQFVYFAMKVIDPGRLSQLPGVTEGIVAARLAAQPRSTRRRRRQKAFARSGK